MFELSGTFKAKIISGTDKLCTLAYPSDKDWCDRVRCQKTIRRSLGRKKAEYDTAPTYDFDAKLIEKLRSDKDGDQFDAHESTTIIDRLDRTEGVDVERQGGSFRITLKVYGGARVSHTLKIPPQKAVDEYARDSGKTRFDGKNTETRSFLEPSGLLYDGLLVSFEGYEVVEGKASVPINHKAAALTEMLVAIAEASAEDDLDPEE